MMAAGTRRCLVFAGTSLMMLFLLTACGFSNLQETGKGQAVASQPKLRVAAAADLVSAFREIAADFEHDTGIPVELIFGSTGTAAMQIENGAPYDVFAAADVSFVEGLKNKGLTLPDTQQLYAQGRIGIATLPDSPLAFRDLKELAASPKVQKIAIADPAHAPYGRAAQQAFQHLQVWDAVKSKLAYSANVQDALTMLKSRNVDAAIISLSLYKPGEVNFTLVDSKLHAPLNQMITVLKASKQTDNAGKFIAYVNGPKGRAIMKKYGFLLPDEIASTAQ